MAPNRFPGNADRKLGKMKLYTRVKATISMFYIDIECVVLQCFGGVCVWVGCLLLSRTSLESVAIIKDAQ